MRWIWRTILGNGYRCFLIFWFLSFVGPPQADWNLALGISTVRDGISFNISTALVESNHIESPNKGPFPGAAVSKNTYPNRRRDGVEARRYLARTLDPPAARTRE